MTKLTSTLAILMILNTGMAYAATGDADGDGVPDISEPLLHTDPQNADTDGDGANDLADADPVFAADPMVASGAAAPFHIGEVLVENNVDPVTHKTATDHLEIQVLNDTAQPITGLTLYYTLTDADSGAKEAYIAHPSVTIPASGEARIHLDDSGSADHLRANPNSIYITSPSAKHVTVALQAKGFMPVSAAVEKDAGGAEKAD